MSKSSLKTNMSTNQVENAVSIEKSRWFNKPAQKKQVQEMVYVDTTPKIVNTKKEKLTSDDKKTLKIVKHDHKLSMKNK